MQPTSYLEQYFEPFREWLSRDDIVELAINPNGQVWVEVAGDATMRPAGKRVEAKAAQNLAQSIVGDAKARVSEKNPLVSGKIDYAGRPLRVQIAVPPAIEQGASITIRLFAPKTAREFKPAFLFGEAVSLETLRREKMRKVADLSQANLDQALKSLIEDRLNILVSGGTSTGKTTFARNLMSHMDHGERLITIEDAFELFPDQPNTVSLLSERSPASQRSANALLQASLRMRPDRIIVGELRGSEALTYLEAINTGHGGSVSTIHAETAELAIDRLAIMVLQAGTPLTFAEVREYIRKSIDVIVQLGRADGRRGITEFYLPVNE
ncbi:P-type DNA transfer ATPase VirB11 [Phaeobacter inhibens]|uniref:Type IV secretion system protein n=1 Tax=Phaeobacter inhibens TaxID=221822 RepID=A0A2I7KG26_9RHOB|nr:P-type DNA transfer ATPase VirB11 [Phaeobacter inhibens]AUR01536.1 P-type DNA transfer ATPase VirB11 [Phaeobacter inhibens]